MKYSCCLCLHVAIVCVHWFFPTHHSFLLVENIHILIINLAKNIPRRKNCKKFLWIFIELFCLIQYEKIFSQHTQKIEQETFLTSYYIHVSLYRTLRSDNLWMSYQWLHVQERGDDDVGGQAVPNQADLPQSAGPVCKSTKETVWSFRETCVSLDNSLEASFKPIKFYINLFKMISLLAHCGCWLLYH